MPFVIHIIHIQISRMLEFAFYLKNYFDNEIKSESTMKSSKSKSKFENELLGNKKNFSIIHQNKFNSIKQAFTKMIKKLIS